MAASLAAPLILFKRASYWPFLSKALLLACVAGLAALVVSAASQNQPTSALLLHYVSMALFVAVAVKTTGGTGTASQLLAYASLGSALFFLILGTENTSGTFEHLWKYGLAVPLSAVALWVAVLYAPGRIVYAVVLTLLGGTSMALGFRSHGLVCVLALIAVLVKGRTGRHLIPKALFAGFGVWLAGVVLPNAISNGVFGEAVQRRTLEQTAQGASPLLAGRVEPPLSLAMIAEKPVLGWGNIQSLDRETLNDGASLAQHLGLGWDTVRRIWTRDDGRVSLHSVFFEAWANGGIFAVVMPTILLILFVAAIIKASGQYTPFVVLIAVQGCWDVVFSTWGYNQAFSLAFSAVVCSWAVTQRPGTREKRKRLVVVGHEVFIDAPTTRTS